MGRTNLIVVSNLLTGSPRACMYKGHELQFRPLDLFTLRHLILTINSHAELNADLPERLGRTNHQANTVEDSCIALRTKSTIEQYYKMQRAHENGPKWLDIPEVPTIEEMLAELPDDTHGLDDAWSNDTFTETADLIDLNWEENSNERSDKKDEDCYPAFNGEVNTIRGAFESKEKYLEIQYKLLREDTVRHLRELVKTVRANPTINEEEIRDQVGIYSHTRVCGVTLARHGMAFRYSFSLEKVGKQIAWNQSKRLNQGSLVVLISPDSDSCKVAIVAARPLCNVEKAVPEIDLYFATPNDIDLDGREWIMVEHRSAYFEANRHTLLALQHMYREDSCLYEHIVGVKSSVAAPDYVRSHPQRNLDCITTETQTRTLPKNINILREWPELPTALDDSQQQALRRMLTKRLAIIQGPPGTGKTFVSVQSLSIMLNNWVPGDPPIIITCQTNHALDQILRLIAIIEPDFARLGGRSKDKDVVKRRTMYELRQIQPGEKHPRGIARQKALQKALVKCLDPLSKELLDLEDLQRYGVLNEAQCLSLVQSTEAWVSANDTGSAQSPLVKWVGHKNIVKANSKPYIFDFGDIEDDEFELEEVQENDAEFRIADEDEEEELNGPFVRLDRFNNMTGAGNLAISDSTIADRLNKTDDLGKIKPSERGAFYRYWQKTLREQITKVLRTDFAAYMETVSQRNIGLMLQNESILRCQKVIGVTTTGIAKNRALLSSLRPRLVFIEEAAETMEAPVAVACMPTVEHLILVGDHKQLRPHCSVKELEDEPHNLNISMFERLIMNNVEFDVLQRQRRMHPEIRRLLTPIYETPDSESTWSLQDHPSVLDRPTVAGMGDLSTWFFMHAWPEGRDQESSTFNIGEATMIVKFVTYLILNGVQPEKITILTFYNGQRRKLFSIFRQEPELKNYNMSTLQVVTVDSYQGEENDVVILSLVRNNEMGKIGFLNVENRVCVALSRARLGFYMFGNASLLGSQSDLWANVLRIMVNGTNVDPKFYAAVDAVRLPKGKSADKQSIFPRVGFSLPLCCSNHWKLTFPRGKCSSTDIFNSY